MAESTAKTAKASSKASSRDAKDGAPARPKAARPRRRASAKADSSTQVRLTGDRLVVEVSENGERRSRSGLLIPATAAQAPKRCVWADVSLVGPDVRGVKVGDRILFLPQAGLEVEIDGDEYLLLRERDVQAVSSPPADEDQHRPGQYL
jgi:chaperonin GroES